ncbi:MAG TPA: hypothetical protein VF079_05645 [Sphingomicrobium sp.]
MKRRALWSIGSLALVMNIVAQADARQAPDRVILDADGNVRTFYGVPVNLTRAGLKRLPFRVKRGHKSSEGIEYAIYKISAPKGVQVEVTFEDGGKLSEAETESPNATAQKGIGVGSTLAEVKAAWPHGMFMYGFADGRYVTFVTGTNVLLRFDPDDMPLGSFDHETPEDFPVPDTIRVQRISIYPKPNPVPKGGAAIDLNKNSTTVEIGGKTVARLDVERTPGSQIVRLTWSREGRVERDALLDVSRFPDFDIWSRDLIHDTEPVVVAFRYGNFKNCAVSPDDRDHVYVTLDRAGATLSSSPPQGVRAPDERWSLPKFVGKLMNSAAHGCRRTYDPHTGAFGLERDGA